MNSVGRETRLLALIAVTVSAIVLTLKLSTPAYVQVIIEGNSTIVREIPNLYTSRDVVTVLVFSFILGFCTAYLLSRHVRPEVKLKVGEVDVVEAVKLLSEDELKVYTLVKEEGLIYQHEIVRATGFSKAKVSRILDKLEAMGLVERKRRGMSNIVLLRK